MLKILKLRPSLLTVLTAAAVLSVACSGVGGTEGDSPAAAAAPSLANAPAGAPPPGTTAGFVDAPGDRPVVTPPDRQLEIPADVPEELKIIWEVWSHLGNDYVDRSQLDAEQFSVEAIRGMLRVLQDRQTSYVPPEVLAGDFQDVFTGRFEGIGAFVETNRAGKLVIVSPIEGGPAALAGIKPGDIILEVDGESIEGLATLEAVAKIRGPKGSTVRLLVKHLGALDPVEISVQRGVIPLTSVVLRSQPGDKFAHVRVTNFYPATAEQLLDTVGKAIDAGAEGLILDLRNNPGGPLDATVDVASEFLTDGLVLYDINGDGHRRDWEVREGGALRDIPMVVLINENSASASEVLAGALQDHDRALLIGTNSFGKGSVNILRPLSNGGGLYITVGHWFTPSGRLIQKDGIEPDIEVVDRDRRDADVAQLRRAIEELEQITGITVTEGKSS